MVIEKDPDSYSELENFFQGNRFRVIITTFSLRMLEYIKSANPDLILIGLSLQNNSEFDLIINLRKDPLTENIPLIAMIPRKDENFVFNYKILGFQDYIVKPFQKEQIISRVNETIQEYKGVRRNKSDVSNSHINVVSLGFQSTIYLKSSLSIYVASEISDILNKAILQKLKDDTICIDIRGLFDLQLKEIAILQRIILLFPGRPVGIVAGRYFGLLLESGNFEQVVQVFMTPEEYQASIEK
ncbi:response regulator [Leptospira sp. GIMC2001]|uniref:response regulator n=1 Tax=Leptospira sp. GIMC2001 TaxID=1513297 RepID=UPI00234A8081|nr:response regulator [Leptospira sp. GIMC2001]WCL49470.1 response regulator [Leptospira sp. GIMC2001]